MASLRTWMMSIKAVLISTGVAAMAVLLKVSVPVAVDFSVSQAPILWSCVLSWLKPPYLYFVTNGIIITIAASSRLYQSSDNRDGEDDDIVVSGGCKIQVEQMFHRAPPRHMVVMAVDSVPNFGFETVSMAEDEEEEEEKGVVAESLDLVANGGDEIEKTTLWWTESPGNSSENLSPPEKPLLSDRFDHRRSVKSCPEGGARRHETLENTWKMIMEGKSTSLTRQFMKCDTWQNQDREISKTGGLKKCETFRDRTNYYESPLSQDELNRRVEAFIKKFNEDMRLQRLESLKQYKEMVSRGT